MCSFTLTQHDHSLREVMSYSNPELIDTATPYTYTCMYTRATHTSTQTVNVQLLATFTR